MKHTGKTIEEYMSLDYPFIVTAFSDNDFNGYKAFLLDIPAVESIGITPSEALHDLDEVKREWIMFAIDKGITIPEPSAALSSAMAYSGRITLRIPKTLHRQVAERALLDGVSLNSYLNKVINSGMADSTISRP